MVAATTKLAPWSLFFTLFILSGCDDAPTSTASLCGPGEPRLEVGIDDPFVTASADGFSIDEGLQGGYHVDVSVRVRGLVDPDDVDISMSLRVDGDLVARHRTDNWLLKIYDDGPHCEYPRARLVLSHRDGSLFELERVMTLVGKAGQLEVSLQSPQGSGEGQFTIDFSHINRR